MTQYAPTRKDRLLEHSLRQRIVELINDVPGISKGRLRKTLGCSWGTIHHHMNLLVREGFVLATQAGRGLRYFAADMNRRVLDSVAVVKRGRALELVSVIIAKPDRNQSDLLADINMTRKVLRPHIDRLTEAGLVEEVRENGCCMYRPTPHLQVVMEYIEEGQPRTSRNDDGPDDEGFTVQSRQGIHGEGPQRFNELLRR